MTDVSYVSAFSPCRAAWSDVCCLKSGTTAEDIFLTLIVCSILSVSRDCASSKRCFVQTFKVDQMEADVRHIMEHANKKEESAFF